MLPHSALALAAVPGTQHFALAFTAALSPASRDSGAFAPSHNSIQHAALALTPGWSVIGRRGCATAAAGDGSYRGPRRDGYYGSGDHDGRAGGHSSASSDRTL